MHLVQKVNYNNFLICLMLLTLFIFFASGIALAKEPDPGYILKKVQENYDNIEDYSATVKIDVDIPNFRIPRKKVRLYYKKPDKVLMKTSGFAILPKGGVLPTPSNFIKEGAQLEYNRSERIGSVLYYIIDVISEKNKKLDVDISIWVNSKRWTIDKVVSSIKDGKSEMKFHYIKIDDFWLPDTSILEINFSKWIPEIPRPTMRGSFGKDLRKNINKEGETKGRIVVAFSDFLVNIGLDDELFKGEK